MDIHKKILLKRQQLREISYAIDNHLNSINKIDKPHLYKEYDVMKQTILLWKQQQTKLIEEIGEYNRKYVLSPLEDLRFKKESS
jgi:hypothetical protein